MKSFKLLLSLLLVCVLLFGAFSTTVSASNDFDLTTLNWSPQVKYSDGTYSASTNLRPLTHLIHWDNTDPRAIGYPQELRFNYTSSSGSFSDVTSTIIVPQGDGFSIQLNNLRDRIVYYDSSGNEVGTRYRNEFKPSKVKIILYRIDKTYLTLDPDQYTTHYERNRLWFNVVINEVPFDVARITVAFTEDEWPFVGDRPSSYSTYARQLTFDNLSTHTVKKVPEEKGLLKSIIAWLTSIKTGITDLFNSILELPSKLFDMIKSLFIPSEDYFDNYGERWDNLLSSRFGAVYQAGGFAVDFATSILNSMNGTMTKNIQFPLVSIPVGNNTNFEFGGWTIPVQVQGLSFIYTASRTIFGVVGTLLFIKGMRRKYDEVMGVSG